MKKTMAKELIYPIVFNYSDMSSIFATGAFFYFLFLQIMFLPV
jgi:hypothetical protein